jgi:hypothetical protein
VGAADALAGERGGSADRRAVRRALDANRAVRAARGEEVAHKGRGRHTEHGPRVRRKRARDRTPDLRRRARRMRGEPKRLLAALCRAHLAAPPPCVLAAARPRYLKAADLHVRVGGAAPSSGRKN